MARSAASHLILEHDTNIADRHIRMSVTDADGNTSRVDATVPGSLSLSEAYREDGWTRPSPSVKFEGSVAEALAAHSATFQKLGLRVVKG